jgi:hypothetical protein
MGDAVDGTGDAARRGADGASAQAHGFYPLYPAPEQAGCFWHVEGLLREVGTRDAGEARSAFTGIGIALPSVVPPAALIDRQTTAPSAMAFSKTFLMSITSIP